MRIPQTYLRIARFSLLSTGIAFSPVRASRLPNHIQHRAFHPDQIFPSDDDEKRIRLPYFKYGYRTEPFQWNELVDIVQVQQDLSKLSRSVDQQRDYEIYKRELKKTWSSVVDHVLCTKFPNVFERKMDPESKLYSAHPPLAEAAAAVDIPPKVLVPNNFPYYTADGIEHWVLWKLGEVCSDEDIEEAKGTLSERFGDDMIHWVNPPHLKSLPEIDHVHILGRVLKRASA